MSNFQKILDSFSLKDSLNPKIWENPEDPKKSKMIPKVRKALMKIANEFIDYLGDDAFVEDVVLTGSLANFNWSEFSDFDLHVIVDVDRFGKQKDTFKELFNLKKQVFNDKHDIKIFGYDVELYAQDETETHKSSGVYSLMEDKWVHQPSKDKVQIDKDVISSKVGNWHEKIDNAIEDLKGDSLEQGKKKIEDLKEKLKDYRKSGLEEKGELAYENLVFKFLRRDGTIEKLFNAANKFTDKELSIEQQLSESIKKYLLEQDGFIDKIIKNSNFIQDLMDLVKKGQTYTYEPGKIKKQQEVELIQTALQYLGFSLPKWGVDGKFGPETKNAVKKFQEKFFLPVTGEANDEVLKYLVAKLVFDGFKDEDLGKIQKDKEFTLSNITDENFYKRLLQELGAPVTDENLKFLYAWRQAEGKGGTNNPFNTTWKLPGSTNMNRVGVQHYLSKEDGMIATLKTLKNGRYSCIVQGLRNDIGASEIAKCPSLGTWGTGDLVAKVVNSYERGASPKIRDLA
jgi:peptidoglycan hydrolase-like protein with peptidoglycan-binding domain/predicted nucleotidyltransferase